MLSASITEAARRNAEWKRRPSPIPHTVFQQPCINFVNSEFLDHVGSGRSYDRLMLAAWRRWFLGGLGLSATTAPTAEEMTLLWALRDRLRRLLEKNAIPPTASELAWFNRILREGRLAVTLTLDRSNGTRLAKRLEPAARGWKAAMALVVSSYADLAASGDLKRVKRCANPNCSYLFFDSTKNTSRRWCQAQACGNLVKVRLHRTRVGISGLVARDVAHRGLRARPA